MVLRSFCLGLIIWILRLGGRLLFERDGAWKMLIGLVFAGVWNGWGGNAGWL
jgi:hypothetical protein